MERTLIKNVGTLVTGDIGSPLAEADAILIEGSHISYVGMTGNLESSEYERVIDAAGMTLLPGLIDSHIHPAIGEYTPMQNMIGYIGSYLHGGTTTMISNGEVLLPGQPRGVDGLKALAIFAAQSYQNYRPSGVKVRGGTLLLREGFSEEDFAELSRLGVRRGKLLYEIKPEIGARYASWARNHNLKLLMHCGGTSVPGGLSTTPEQVLKIRPHVLAHLNGGPTAMPPEAINTLIDETRGMIELVLCGNPRAAIAIIAKVLREDQLERVILGTDTPTGSGIIPLGMWQLINLLTGFSDLKPEVAICLATGNTARFYGLGSGFIREGSAADLILADAPAGSAAPDTLGAIAAGDIPAIALVMIDGEIVVEGSRNSSPPKRRLKIER